MTEEESNKDKFTHLHCHTEFSTLDGVNRIDTFIKHTKEVLGQKACSITDHGGSVNAINNCDILL